jgi:lysophospholipase L1-like esterase
MTLEAICRTSVVLALATAIGGAIMPGSVWAQQPAADTGTDTAWVEPMRKAHARFTGTKGTLACLGDSITVTMAFWSPLAHAPKELPPAMAKDLTVVKDYMKPECWAKWKGAAYGNEGSMTIRWAHDNIDQWLKKLNPEAVVLMFGTNDLTQLAQAEFDEKTRAVVDRCLRNGTLVMLTTLPPRSGLEEKSRQFADTVRRIARDKQVPLIDYQAEILKRRPNDWDGTLAKFKGADQDVYQVPTLIAGDGVHPSNPRAYQDYSEVSLRHNGYTLRNYLTLRMYAAVIRKVLQPAPGGA